MGLFDHVTCEWPLPDPEVQEAVFQTKCLDPGLSSYRISADGRLLLKTDDQRLVEIPHHGDVLLLEIADGWVYEYSVRFTNGRVQEVKRIRKEPARPRPDPPPRAPARKLDVKIRALDDDEGPVWAAMRHALWPEAPLEELQSEAAQFLSEGRRWFGRPGQVLVAEGEDRLVGFVEISQREHAEGCRTSPVGFVEGWWVDPSARRAGVGSRLMEAALGWMRDCGLAEAASDAVVGNWGSDRAHRRLGFEEVERRVCYRRQVRPR